jgi:hypothetical protein
MPDPLTRLIALTITQGVPTPAILARAHTAAYLLGVSERTGVGLEAFKGLSKAERADIKKVVEGQLKYLAGFKDDMAGMSDKAIEARAAKYAGALKATYSEARWGDWDLPFVPTVGSECQTNCKCSIVVEDQGEGKGQMIWKMHADEHCTTCRSRAEGSPHPVERRAA